MDLANGDSNLFFSFEDPGARYLPEGYVPGKYACNDNIALLCQHIAPHQVVLDIGCGYGKVGMFFKEKQEEHTLYGLEPDPSSRAHALAHGGYAHVFAHKVEDLSDAAIDEMTRIMGGVDTIILSDVLEHFENPTRVLERIYPLLKPRGQVLVSVPNIGHADIALHLLNGIFNYAEAGILDNTHLKFFTRRSFLDWIALFNKHFEHSRYDLQDLGATFYNNAYLEGVKTKFPTLYGLLEHNAQFNALQVLFKLTKLSKAQEPISLNALLKEPGADIVSLLGARLESQPAAPDTLPKPMLASERGWYEQEIAKALARIEGMEGYARQLEERVEGMGTYARQLEEQVQGMGGYARQLEERVQGMGDYARQLEERVQGMGGYSQRLEERIHLLEAELSRRDADVLEKNKHILELKGYCKDLETGNAALMGNKEGLEAALKEAGAHIQMLEGNLAEKDALLHTQTERYNEVLALHTLEEEELKALKTDFEQLSEDRERIAAELREVKTAILNMEESLSWRATRFLRRK